MHRLLVMMRTLPPGATWLFASAVLALLGAANASWHGLRHLAEVGVVGAIVALAVVCGCCDWRQPPRLRRR